LFVENFDHTLSRQSAGAPLLLTTGPTPVGMDVRLAPVLRYAVAHRLMRRGPVRRVLGHRCQVFRTAVALGGAVLCVLPVAPAGFVETGRYAVVPPQPRTPLDPSARLRLVSGVRDVYVRGADVIVVDQGGTLGGVAPFRPVIGVPTVRTPAGTGQVL